MTPLLTINLLRVLFVTFTALIGSMITVSTLNSWWLGLVLGSVFGLSVVLADRLLKGFSLRLFSSATFGLLLGFLFSRLLLASDVLRWASEEVAWFISLGVYATCGYLGMMLAIRSNRDEFALVIPYIRFRRATLQDEPLLVDSNIIIDGRLPELCGTGFISSSLIIPRFVLDELQRLADSHDSLKRERGRVALERLQQMKQNPALSITIHETEGSDDLPVDTRLAQLARLLDARLLTNDSNLGSVARLQGVSVLNLHQLARALRPPLGVGQEIELILAKEGREPHQAVGYLADGTMIVVNHARAHLGKAVLVMISSSLQTSAGRLFFAELKESLPSDTPEPRGGK
jgi:uncharacterized protein YacL